MSELLHIYIDFDVSLIHNSSFSDGNDWQSVSGKRYLL